jgi:hypothetical protein
MKTKILRYAAIALGLLIACSQATPVPGPQDAQTFDRAAIGAGIALPDGQPACGDMPCPDPGAVQVPSIKAKLDARTPAQIAAAACRRSDGGWACPAIPRPLMAGGNATAAQCGPACTVGAWWFDPSNTTGCASDTNSGTSATCSGAGIGPLATFAQFILRVGSTIPQYPGGQGVSVTQMSAQAANTDFIFFEPRMASTATSQAAAIFTVTPLAVGAPQTITVNTSLTRGAPGTLLVLTNPTGIAANQLIVNTTRGSQAIVDSVGATTVMQTPQTTATLTNTAVIPSPVEDITPGWQTGNTVQLYTLQNSNLQRWTPVGANLTTGGAPTSGWIFYANVADTSGSNASAFFFDNTGAVSVLVNSVVNPRLHIATAGGRGFVGLYLLGSSMLGPVFSSAAEGGFYGGAFKASGNNFFGQPTITNDAILHLTTQSLQGSTNLGNVYSDGILNVGSGPSGGPGIMQVSGSVWGSYSLNVRQASAYINQTGSTFLASGALLTSGTVSIGTLTTGCTPAVSGTYVSNGAMQVDTACAFGTIAAPGNCFPATAPISISLATAVSPSPQFFSAAQTAGTFHTKGTAGDTSTYNWTAGKVCGIPITVANLDYTTGYGSLCNIAGNACIENPN